METKLDLVRKNAQEREVRQKNAESLKALLEEAKELSAVIPRDHQLETQRELQIVTEQINRLTELLDDETRAIAALSGMVVTDAEVERVVAKF